MTCRWKDDDGNQRYDCFIPEIDRPGTADFPESQPGEKRQRQPRRPTSKGALFSEYNRLVHEWLTHLRRVHFRNPPLNTGGKVVNATNPLAPKGESLYYVHSNAGRRARRPARDVITGSDNWNFLVKLNWRGK
jgi:hypothetical protein